jgi:hypothetical protein
MSEIETNNTRNKDDNLAAPLAFLTAPIRFIGSLTFGIILLTVLLVLLAWGTFIESEYGSAVSRFILYGNLWFFALVTLLALNLVFHIVGRFPWRRYDIPFLIVHVGILLLLFGCLLTLGYGEEAQITLPEGTIGRVAVKPERLQFEFKYIVHSLEDTPKTLNVPFYPGPFSWQDYQFNNWIKDEKRYKTILWYAMQFGRRDIGALPSGDPNVKIEVLDYHARSSLEPVPSFDVSILWTKKTVRKETELGEVKETPRNWDKVSLNFAPRQLPSLVSRVPDFYGISATATNQKEPITYRMAISTEELTAFQKSRPKGGTKAGLWGEIVLYYGGEHYHVNVDLLRNLPENQRFSVEDSDLQIGNVWFYDRVPVIMFDIFTPSGEKEAMQLLPGNPEWNAQARRLGVFGSYWVEPQRIVQQSAAHADDPMLEWLALPRLDFMQGTDKKLYYRFWSGQKIIADGVVPDGKGQEKPKLKLAEQTSDEVEVVIERFMPHDVAGYRIVSSSIDRGQQTEQRVKLRVTFDGKEDTFWICAATPEQDQIRYIYGDDRTLCVQLDYEGIDLGFGILLKKCEKRTEPGTPRSGMSAFSSSLVDYVEPKDPANKVIMADRKTWMTRKIEDYRAVPNGENVLISLNRPDYYRGTGRGYRIYHSSYRGTYYADQRQFRELYGGTIFPWETRPRESISVSTLSVNADPGRGWKYLGSFMIVLGMALFVWRKHL